MARSSLHSATFVESPDEFQTTRLSIVVLGASGDLAKKKTYPALFDLYAHDLIPKILNIAGYARSASTSEAFREKIRPWLLQQAGADEVKVDAFLKCCTYVQGGYDDPEAFKALHQHLLSKEAEIHVTAETTNRLFYLALPGEVFFAASQCIRQHSMSTTGFNRVIVEKPFGRDLPTAQKLVDDLATVLNENDIFRIDHYLAKEIVQSLFIFRFGNTWLEPLFNHQHVSAVRITFKEEIGTEGRGGYFTNYGIIRDVIQNHLLQVMSLVAMEAPPAFEGPTAGNDIRDAKNNVLRCARPIDPDEVVIGQYVAANGKPGYLDDDSIRPEDREKAKKVPTFASVVMRIDTPRWHGVPFILKAGKALDSKGVEIRVQFKDPPAADHLFGKGTCARNELVMQLQPEAIVYMKVNIKAPGLSFQPAQSELDLTYGQRYKDVYNPDAYPRLILDALHGNHTSFVRSDELLNSWKLFTPLLLELDKRDPIPYEFGSRGPSEADELHRKCGFIHQSGYRWQPAT